MLRKQRRRKRIAEIVQLQFVPHDINETMDALRKAIVNGQNSNLRGIFLVTWCCGSQPEGVATGPFKNNPERALIEVLKLVRQ